jgi:hypothetical protein
MRISACESGNVGSSDLFHVGLLAPCRRFGNRLFDETIPIQQNRTKQELSLAAPGLASSFRLR